MASYHRVARHEGVRDARYKLIQFTEPGFGGFELYDLQVDPDELRNRIGDPALTEVKTRLMARMELLKAQLRAPD